MITKENLPLLANEFLSRVFAELGRKNFYLENHWHIDHLCYRTSTSENYLAIKNKFERFAELLIESEVNGRMISTFKLDAPLCYGDWEIDLIEVPAPKIGKIVADGFEHFEVVCDVDFTEIKSRYKGHHFDDSGLSKDFNQELEIMFDGFAVKFHQMSLESVVRVEGNERIFSALKRSQVLKCLRPFRPLVGGTFPLDLHVAASDVDIFVSGDFDLIRSALAEKFESMSEFHVYESTVHGQPSLIVGFQFDGVKFEVFAQAHLPTVRQQGVLHFLAEERLLKLGGASLHKKIRNIREQGAKTESAFAKALGLKGDPFAELLNLQKMSNQELKRLLKS